MNETQRTNHADRIMSHGHDWFHGLERSFEGHIQKRGDKEVIIVVTKRHLIIVIITREGEQHLATVPGTEETLGLAAVCALVERAVEDMQRDALAFAELLQVGAVGVVWYVVHDDMGGGNLDMRFMDAALARHETYQFQRILAAGECDKDSVVILQEPVLGASAMK